MRCQILLTLATVLISSTPLISRAQAYAIGEVGSLLYSVEIPTGHSEPIGNGPLPGFTAMASSKQGNIYAVSRALGPSQLFNINPSTGEGTNLGDLEVGADQHPIGIAFDDEGRLFVLANAYPQSALYLVDPANADTTFVSWLDNYLLTTFAIFEDQCFALDAYGRLQSVDLATGEVSELPSSVASLVYDLSFDTSGRLWGIEEIRRPWGGCYSNFLVQFDLSTGAFTTIAEVDVIDDCLRAFVIRPDQSPQIPTQNPIGFLVLIVTIAALGVASLISHNR